MVETDNEQPKEEQPTVEIKRIRSENFVTVYSNQVQIGISPYDFQLVFGKLNTSLQRENTLEELVSVYMSPQHAKAMVLPLLNLVIQYERQFGQINLILDESTQGIFKMLQEIVTKAIQSAATGQPITDVQADPELPMGR